MWAKSFEHNGIKYERLGTWSVISNKYRLSRDYSYQTKILGYFSHTDFITLYKDGQVDLREGFLWDGPSGPTFDSKNFMRGSLEHDPIYSLIRLGLLPAWVKMESDRQLYVTCREDGMSKFRAGYVYEGVAKLAGFAILPTS